METFDFKKFRKDNKMSQKDAANYFGVGQSFISMIETGVCKVPKEFISKISADKDFDKSALPGYSEAKTKNIDNFVYVPLIPIRAKAGYLEGYSDEEYIESLPTLPVITDKTFHGRYRCFEVEGDSMDDGTRNAICERDVVLAREVRKELWRYKLHINDWVFVIVHKTEGILIKQIVEHERKDGIITCHSTNPIYGPDFKIDLLDVKELYNVIKIVDRNLKM